MGAAEFPAELSAGFRLRLLVRRALGPLLATRPWARLAATRCRRTVPVLARHSRAADLPPLLTVAVALAETGLRGEDVPGRPRHGWFQMRLDPPPYPTSERSPALAEAHDLDYSAREFCAAAAAHAARYPALRRDLWLWAVKTQGVGESLDRNPSYAPAVFATYLHEAAGLLAEYDSQRR